MKRIRIYHHPSCARCARIARMHRRFDWLDRVETSTATPPGGPLRLGEITVEDLRTGEFAKGAAAVEQIARNIPAYTPMAVALKLPFVRRKVERDVSGCDRDACAI